MCWWCGFQTHAHTKLATAGAQHLRSPELCCLIRAVRTRSTAQQQQAVCKVNKWVACHPCWFHLTQVSAGCSLWPRGPPLVSQLSGSRIWCDCMPMENSIDTCESSKIFGACETFCFEQDAPLTRCLRRCGGPMGLRWELLGPWRVCFMRVIVITEAC